MLLDLIVLKNKYNLNIKGVLHIGAHYGQELSTYENVEIDNVMFFEPLPHTFEKLKDNTKGKNVILVNTALGNTIGEVDMNVEYVNQGQSSSILEPLIHLQQYPHIRFIEDKDKYNFINIDVQGYELEVFKGASEYLKTIDYIITEVNRGEVYKNCPMVEELDEYLKPYGFERVETTWDGVTWGDAFYIKNNEKI
jgi:FkbM family methyltransferase